MSALRAGAARACITPHLGCHIMGYFNDRIAENVADDLFAKAVVLDNGDTAVAIVVLDLVCAFRADFDRARKRAHELTGIPPQNIFMSCTHTHFGPSTAGCFNVPREEQYMHWAMDRAGDAVRMAQQRLQPAQVGHASGQCPEETHNRRWHMRDGTVQMNPGYENPQALRPAGPTDPEVGLLVVVGQDDKPIAVVANYSLHYVGGPFALEISADYFGAFDRAMQRIAGEQFVAIMMNGCCGDINNCDFSRPAPPMPHPFYQVERVADVVAARAYGAWRTIREFSGDIELGAVTVPLTFRRRHPTDDELQAARRLRAAKTAPDDPDWMYAGETIAVAQEPLERETPIMSLGIGDLGITGVPGEAFVEIGLQIKQQSTFARTLVAELANDYLGYIPTDKALDQGSYETRLATTAKAARGTQGALVHACGRGLELLRHRS